MTIVELMRQEIRLQLYWTRVELDFTIPITNYLVIRMQVSLEKSSNSKRK